MLRTSSGTAIKTPAEGESEKRASPKKAKEKEKPERTS